NWNGTNGGIFKSTDGGTTWKQLTYDLPADLVQANIAIAPSAPQTLFAAVATKTASQLLRSDDGGGSWRVATEDSRPAVSIGGGDLPVVRFDPKDANVVYSVSVVAWKSTDGGKTWTAWRGAPGGDDYQNIWINPNNPEIILLGSDQGAIVTVNGGDTWSSWYNQSTAQLYHVSADNSFPYRLYSGQQESGSVGILSRGNDGAITFRDWHPVSAEEYGYVVADPLDPDTIYGGKISRYDRRTGQAKNIFPLALRSPDFRTIRTEPVVFSPVDPHLLFFAGNTLWQTRDRGENWTQISPDLTRKTYELPASIAKYRDQPTAEAKQRGVIYAVAPSPLDVKRIWAGTDDGLIHLTTDGGKTWKDVTPPQITAWQKISILDAGHFDANTAYAAVNAIRVDDLRPHIYRTHDSGKTWQEITRGLPDGNPVNVVREDTQRKSLLFAGTERAVYYSLDEGENWQPLRLNMPATSVRDLIVKGDDLCVATHGRGFWILDNITPLRQYASAPFTTALLQPQTAFRVRWNMNTDTPLPPDEPAGQNPPEGAMIDYSLGSEVSGEVTLEIKDGKGAIVRRYSSTDPAAPPDPREVKVPMYWLRPPQPLMAKAGLHRFLWDMHYQPIPGVDPQYPIAAVPHETAPEPTGPWAMPGQYSVVLTANGKTFTQPLVVKMDPRVKASNADLAQQFDLSKKLYEARPALVPIEKQLLALGERIDDAQRRTTDKAAKDKFAAAEKELREFGSKNGRPGAPLSLGALGKIESLFHTLQEADATPTPRVKDAVPLVLREAEEAKSRWQKFIANELPAINQQLQAAGVKPLPADK
ncbi:MAG: glycoside hydrolase, partial [Verrucomicrobiota bacterium]|nr:glycoside hydrolase [Verrucomicrobiota bacterium]